MPYILSVHKDIKITSHDCLCKDAVVVFNLKMENSFFFLDDDDDDDEIVTMISTTLFLFLYKMFLDDHFEDKYKFSLIFGHNNFFFLRNRNLKVWHNVALNNKLKTHNTYNRAYYFGNHTDTPNFNQTLIHIYIFTIDMRC